MNSTSPIRLVATCLTLAALPENTTPPTGRSPVRGKAADLADRLYAEAATTDDPIRKEACMFKVASESMSTPSPSSGIRVGVSFEFGIRLAPEYVVWLVAAVATIVTGVQYL